MKSLNAKVIGRLLLATGYLVGAVTLLITLLIHGASRRTDVAEILEEGRCLLTPCAPPSDEQLRLRVIKAYLHLQLTRNFERRAAGGSNQLVLLPVTLTTASLSDSIRQSTMLDTLRHDAWPLTTHEEIESLSPATVAAHPTMASYSLPHRSALVTPLASIRIATAEDRRAHTASRQAALPGLDRWQAWQGYGQRFFWITEYASLSLACCDGLGDKHGLSVDWLNRDSLNNLAFGQPRLLAVTDRGAILTRGENDDFSYIFF